MSEVLRALVLGIIQGLTEFLPVSSSGHLELAKWLLQDDSLAAESMLMTVTLHAATALATLVVFRRAIAEILRDLFRFAWNDGTRFAALVVVSMVPAAIVGVLFDEALESLFDRQIVLVALMLVLTGLLLLLADRAKDTGKPVGWREAILVGIAQAIAILPGISRSGATISTSVMLGIDREKAARFSFLMVVPLIFGKMAKDLLDGDFSGTASLPALGIGFLAAFATGIVACIWMIRLVKQAKLKWFAFYCFAVAALALAWFTLGD
ncbi:undecaprenyl-diphosphate phosphatase [Neolewinella lacunae]|uniref:Undecaprenyl-diphosphatase n=1 Tax=Neolewinella lacunae TaxID=1517758 RepID=A0A923TB03_9BACT|nr:undecaprenyl-diphosphate phosphatase [Neolewinella lacunae]MBC6996733.1 undecaprenyl-diphosphate phosphatase [Neolewinella lacunae]MDN3633402.1 undecaprenyl-diphosphate phosphatase [Neolewinella lacunae]